MEPDPTEREAAVARSNFSSSFSSFCHSWKKEGESAAGQAMRITHFLKACPKGSKRKFSVLFILIGRSA